jgi:predicted nucleic acid-binding protein
MRSIAVVDTSVLLAALDRSEPQHARCAAVLRRSDIDLVVPALAVAEVAHFVDRRLGPAAEAAFVRGLSELQVEAPEPDDWQAIAEVVERYTDLRLGTVDASVAILAEKLGTDLILSLDRRHFETIRSPGGRAFRLLPELPAVHDGPAAYASPSDSATDGT